MKANRIIPALAKDGIKANPLPSMNSVSAHIRTSFTLSSRSGLWFFSKLVGMISPQVLLRHYVEHDLLINDSQEQRLLRGMIQNVKDQ